MRAIVAAGVMREPAPAPQLPYVWSDQYGRRIQIIGRPALGGLVSMIGTADDHLIAVYADDEGVAVGGVTVDDPRTMLKFRKAIMKRAPASELTLLAPAGRDGSGSGHRNPSCHVRPAGH